MAIKTIRSRAPSRIDLAGGTIDLWPLYLFFENPVTVNMAVDLFAEVELEENPDSNAGILLRSEDQNTELRFNWSELSRIQAPPALELPLKLLRHFQRERQSQTTPGLRILTRAKSPAGAGIGGSSALNIALTGAIASWAREGIVDPLKDGISLIEVARDIETTVIKVPAGLQDYYSAMFGGLQLLEWRAGTHERRGFPNSTLRAIEERILLFYSGQSRNSGINNWALFKGLIDQREDIRHKFGEIVKSSSLLGEALKCENWAEAGDAILREWSSRRELAEGISTPEIEDAIQAASRVARVVPKICGAGGGGCFFLLLTDSDPEQLSITQEKVLDALSRTKVRHLPFKAVPTGLDLHA